MPPTTLFQKAAGNIKTSARNAAVEAAKAGQTQTVEVFKDLATQAGLPKQEAQPVSREMSQPSQIIETIREQGPENIDIEKIKNDESKLLASLEAQLKALREQRQREVIQNNRETQEKFDLAAKVPQVEAPPPPQGKIRKAIGAVKSKAQSIISSRKQGETKAGSGKG